jgi:RNA polymerase sigma-70 factor (ECF subfamily)
MAMRRPGWRTGPAFSSMHQASKIAEFEETIFPHLNAAYNLARWLLRNEHDAEDVAQDAVLRALRYFDSFQGGDAKAWLLGIVRNSCFTWLKRAKAAEPFTIVDESYQDPQTDRPNPETIVLLRENHELLQNCIRALPHEFREIIILRELQEMSYQEIATVAGVPVGTVMSRLCRARKRLEQCVTLRLQETHR